MPDHQHQSAHKGRRRLNLEDVTCKLSLGKLVLQRRPSRDALIRCITVRLLGHPVAAEVGLALLLLLPADLGREAEGRDEVRNVVVVLVQAEIWSLRCWLFKGCACDFQNIFNYTHYV